MRKFNGIDTEQLTAYVYEEFIEFSPSLVYVDGSGLGGGVVDRLRGLGVPVVDVQFGESAVDQQMYTNIRTEIWGGLRRWISGVVDLPVDDDLKRDLITVQYGYDNKMRMTLERKIDMKRRMDGGSPDCGDALAVTFAEYSMPTQRAYQARKIQARRF